MTEIPSLQTYADPQLSSVAYAPVEHVHTNGLTPPDGIADDRIKCICGYEDDDGSTVFCEDCHTWQHIRCYYPDKPPTEDAVHECVECRPRPYDARGAAERQRQWRELQAITIQRSKPRPGKSHKKKVKETPHNVANGWPGSGNHDFQPAVESTNASVRDQPPPAKRPKTSHKSSGSVASLNHPSTVAAGSRKRAGSSALNGQSPTRSSMTISTNGYTDDYFSPEFMQLHQQPQPQHVDANSFTDIAIANDLYTWASDRDALREVTNGKTPQEVFVVPSMSLEELELTAPPITKQMDENIGLKVRGRHPVIQYLTVETSVPMGGYVGELRGRIGRRQDYMNEPSGRWPSLQHPEPFVFLPPHLPIYIDTRTEGTILRYARRSCDPNMRMQIFITKGREYHFCFISTRDIIPEEEITINWDVPSEILLWLDESVRNGNIKKEGIQGKNANYISHWATGVLANFGNCACNRPEGDCLMYRFDLRVGHHLSVPHPPALKPAASRKTKRSGHHASPLSTGYANNSRASSEAVTRAEQDDDNADSRSVSGSSRSKPSSRDITPMTHSTSTNTGLGVEMSDREKRKLLQYEDLFKKQDENGEQQEKRKKRHSAGSTLNTPSIATSRQLGLSDPSAASPPPASVSANRGKNGEATAHRLSDGSTNGQRSSGTMPRPHLAAGNPSSHPPRTVKHVYADASTQTDGDPSPSLGAWPLPIQRRPYVSFKQRLLKRTCEERQRWEEQQRAREEAKKLQNEAPADVTAQIQSPPRADSKTDMEMPPPPVLPPDPVPSTSADVATQPSPQEDVEMKDAADPSPQEPPEASPDESKPAKAEPISENPSQTSHPPIQPPPPPWPSSTPSTVPDQKPLPKPADLRVQLPPVPTFSPQSTSTPSVSGTPGSLTGTMLAQSPSTITGAHPLFSPSIASIVAPSPRKKMSLSDYTKKKKNEALSAVQAQPPTSSANAPTLARAQTDSSGALPLPDPATMAQPATLQSSSSVAVEEVDAPVGPPTTNATEASRGVADVEMAAG